MSRQFSLRPYQVEALDIIHADLQTQPNVLVQMTTGAGKTVTVCRLINHYFFDTDRRFLILAHKQELIRQFQRTFKDMTDIPESAVGIVCSGLGEKNLRRRITIGTVQSFINVLDKYQGCNLLIIDEAHRISIGNDSQYDQTINTLRKTSPNMRLVGITATPYRLGHGYIYGDKATGPNLFPKLNTQIKYSVLRDAGYLMPLEGKVAINDRLADDLGNVRVNGDYVIDQLGEVMTKEIHLHTAIDAIRQYCDEFQRICVFCCTIDHAEKVRALMGNECTIIHSRLTQIERDINMNAWKSGQCRVITSVNILAEGFDFPPLDCLIFARPTLSSGLYVQALGRVLRTSPGKDRAFLLDLTDNTSRFGTDLDKIKVSIPQAISRSDPVLEKICPNCEAVVHPARAQCPECGYEWPHDDPPVAETMPVLNDVFFGKAEPVKKTVRYISYHRHNKKDKPPSMRVSYYGYSWTDKITSEWVCFEHQGFPRRKAEDWWRLFGPQDEKCPNTVEDALSFESEFLAPTEITIEPDGKWVRITDYLLDDDGPSENLEVYDDEVPF